MASYPDLPSTNSPQQLHSAAAAAAAPTTATSNNTLQNNASFASNAAGGGVSSLLPPRSPQMTSQRSGIVVPNTLTGEFQRAGGTPSNTSFSALPPAAIGGGITSDFGNNNANNNNSNNTAGMSGPSSMPPLSNPPNTFLLKQPSSPGSNINADNNNNNPLQDLSVIASSHTGVGFNNNANTINTNNGVAVVATPVFAPMGSHMSMPSPALLSASSHHHQHHRPAAAKDLSVIVTSSSVNNGVAAAAAVPPPTPSSVSDANANAPGLIISTPQLRGLASASNNNVFSGILSNSSFQQQQQNGGGIVSRSRVAGGGGTGGTGVTMVTSPTAEYLDEEHGGGGANGFKSIGGGQQQQSASLSNNLSFAKRSKQQQHEDALADEKMLLHGNSVRPSSSSAAVVSSVAGMNAPPITSKSNNGGVLSPAPNPLFRKGHGATEREAAEECNAAADGIVILSPPAHEQQHTADGIAVAAADDDGGIEMRSRRNSTASSAKSIGGGSSSVRKLTGANVAPPAMSREEQRLEARNERLRWAATLSPYDPRRIFTQTFPDGLLPEGSIGGSAFNLATNTLGAGTIALPAAFAAAGGVLGLVVLLICLAAAIYAMRLQAVVAAETGMNSYALKARVLVGPWAEKLMAIIVIVLCWGVTVVYVVSIGDLLDTFRLYDGVPTIMAGDWGRRFVVTLFWFITMLPLSLPAQINSLRYASLAGLASTGVLIISLMAFAGTHKEVDPATGDRVLLASANKIPVAHFDLTAVMSLPVFIFGTACHTNTYQVYGELNNASPRRMTIVAVVTFSCVGLLYLLCGLTGVAIFGGETKGNILSNFDDPLGTWYITVAFVGMAITLTAAYPLCIFPARDALLQVAFGFKPGEVIPTYIRVPLSGGIAVISLLLGLFVPGVKIMFGLLGGLLGSNVVYIWPAIFAMRMKGWTVANVGMGNIVGAWVLLIFGILAAIFGTAVSIYDLV